MFVVFTSKCFFCLVLLRENVFTTHSVVCATILYIFSMHVRSFNEADRKDILSIKVSTEKKETFFF